MPTPNQQSKLASAAAGQRRARPSQALPSLQRPAIERPAEIHLHLHGVSADDIAAILRRPPE
jgi:hypothetical protein